MSAAPSTELSFRVPNVMASLERLSAPIQHHLAQQGADDAALYAACLALEELFTNIVKYGHQDEVEHEVEVRLQTTPELFRLVLSDDGHCFDPFDQPAPDTECPLEERQIGGLGLHFVRNMLDRCHYERREGRNIVTVEKAMRSPTSA